MYEDTPDGKDPDTYSRTLQNYHLSLWSKPLPNGKVFELSSDENPPFFLRHDSDMGQFLLSSDSILHTYSRWKRESMVSIIQTIPKSDIDAFYDLASTIGGYILFPANMVDGKPTINGIRGMHPRIKDRFDLTLECIRRWYTGEESPLYIHLDRYNDFFRLFDSFKGYCKFFLLDDLVNEDMNEIRFWLPFQEFSTKSSVPVNRNEYLQYKENVIAFTNARSKRMVEYVNEKSSIPNQ